MSRRELTLVIQQLRAIANSLERIEKALPGCNQEALKANVNEAVISLLTSERTPVEYK